MRFSRWTWGLMAFWVVPAIVAVIGFQIVPSARNPDISFVDLSISQLLVWLAWAVWSPIIVAASRRVPFERGHLVRASLMHLVLAVAIISVQLVFLMYVWEGFDLAPQRGLSSKLAIGWRSYGDLYVVVYGGVVGAHAAVRWYEAWQRERLLAAQLERDLAAAQLSALRSQLNPHFLFNSLHSVVTLIGRDPEGARRMVVRLADLLRATLGLADEQVIALSRELEMLRNYLDIELVRFADRLTVHYDLDEELLDCAVPAFALQPIAENAIIHGISRVSGPGVITVAARADGDGLVLTVTDNGPGPMVRPSGAVSGAGIGLANLRARLASLYPGEPASLTLEQAAGGGTRATLRLPRVDMAAHIVNSPAGAGEQLLASA